MSNSAEAVEGSDQIDVRRQVIQRRKQEQPLYYRDYLRINTLLSLQQPLSREAGAEAHDELLFIIVHQAYELWFKQILHEIDSVRDIFSHPPVNERLIGIAVARLQRVAVIQGLLLQQLTVLETMRPVDFLDFRDYLYPASGFQSVQFRLVENRLGLRPTDRMKYGEKTYCSYLASEDAAVVESSEALPSLHDLVEAWLERTPFLHMADGAGLDADSGKNEGGARSKSPGDASVGSSMFTWWDHYKEAVTAMLEADEAAILAHPALAASQGQPEGRTTRDIALRDLASTRKHFDTVLDEKQYADAKMRGERRLSYRAMQAALLITLYSDEPILQLPAHLLSALLDIDENMTAWRHRHALMVHRMLGVKMGTGGSSGYHYLRATAERHRVFVDMFNISTFLIPRQLLPPLPAAVRAQLDFAYFTDSACGGHGQAEDGEVHTGGPSPSARPSYRPQVGPAFASLTSSLGHLSFPRPAGAQPDEVEGGGRCPMGYGPGAR